MKFYNRGNGDVVFSVYNQADETCTFARWESRVVGGSESVYRPSGEDEFKVKVSRRGELGLYVVNFPPSGDDAWIAVQVDGSVTCGAGTRQASCHEGGPF